MSTTKQLIKEWQMALQYEISHIKKFGSKKYQLSNGQLIDANQQYTYFFEVASPIRIPVGTSIRLEWGNLKQNGRILSSEGNSLIVSLEQSIGDFVSDALLFHDPWELLEQLIERLDKIKKSKRKRMRINHLLHPTFPAKHLQKTIKSNVHEVILRSKYNPVTYIWGPPGTGKTYTLARVAGNKYFKEKRVLVLSHSNQAVDVLMSEIANFLHKMKLFRGGDVLRYGTSSEILSNKQISIANLLEERESKLSQRKQDLTEEKRLLKKDLSHSFSQRDTEKLLETERKLAKILEKIRLKEIQYVKDAKVIGATLAKAASDPAIYEQEFDLVIIDEASMAYTPQIAFAASLAKRVIVCGDFKQLPPIAASRHPLVTNWLKEDIFHKASVVNMDKDRELHPHLFLLKEQRRMHADISAFTNRFIYYSLVGDHPSVTQSRKEIVGKKPFPNQASLLLDTSFTGMYSVQERISNSRINLFHLFISFQAIHEAYMDGISSIGYITPFRAQANLMELLLKELHENEYGNGEMVSATVHRFQGSEKNLIVFDVVDGFPQNRPSMLIAGKDSERLVNVAMTRAKAKFIHVCDQNYIRKNVNRRNTIRQLVEHQVSNKQLVNLNEIGAWIRHQHPKLMWMYARNMEQVFQDINLVKHSIIISLPNANSLSKEWENLLRGRSKLVSLTVISPEDWGNLKYSSWIRDKIPFSFIAIDRKIFWMGMPLEGMEHIQPPYLSVRLESGEITEYILKHLPVNGI
ncbi:disulfide oxidoreductase [Heyndrickxia sporothermodurans]|nr:disulfide oxidoreductase [Heyndrickxia sporothermodurans]